jgi:hypothetical protein
VGVAEIQEAVTDELKKVQKEEIWQLFRNCTTAQKPVYIYTNGAYFELKKKVCVFLMFLQFSKNSVQYFWTALCMSGYIYV